MALLVVSLFFVLSVGVASAQLPPGGPTVDAGPDQDFNFDPSKSINKVQLDGSGSKDSDGNDLCQNCFNWSVIDRPGESGDEFIHWALENSDLENPTLIVDVVGPWTVRLTILDDAGTAFTDDVVINVIGPGAAEPPTADAGVLHDVHEIDVGSIVTLDGALSRNSDGNPVCANCYDWTFVSVPEGSLADLQNPDLRNPTFTADLLGFYVVQLIVEENGVFSDSDSVTIHAKPANLPPTAHAGPDQNLDVGSQVTLDGSLSDDPDGDNADLTYSWIFHSFPGATAPVLNLDDSVSPYFTANEVGDYTILLTVNDGLVDSTNEDTNSVVITIEAPARALKLQAVAALIVYQDESKEIAKAIKEINRSLDEGWVIGDDSRLDPKHGNKVFDREKHAVKELMKVVKDQAKGKGKNKVSDDALAAVEAAIADLVAADRILAETALGDVEPPADDGSKQSKKVAREIERAEKELAKAESEIGKGRFDKAIDNFKKAWTHAIKAAKEAAK